MKKLLSIIILTLFAVAIFVSFNQDVQQAVKNLNNGSQYAAIIPLPPPPPPPPKGC